MSSSSWEHHPNWSVFFGKILLRHCQAAHPMLRRRDWRWPSFRNRTTTKTFLLRRCHFQDRTTYTQLASRKRLGLVLLNFRRKYFRRALRWFVVLWRRRRWRILSLRKHPRLLRRRRSPQLLSNLLGSTRWPRFAARAFGWWASLIILQSSSTSRDIAVLTVWWNLTDWLNRTLCASGECNRRCSRCAVVRYWISTCIFPSCDDPVVCVFIVSV